MLRVHCQKCLGDLEPVDWLPEEGLDPRLRKSKCSKCGQEEYQVLTPEEQKKFQVRLIESIADK